MNIFSTTGLIVFGALLGSVFSQCYLCMENTTTSCTPVESPCVGDWCMTISQYIYLDGRSMRSVYKGCANKTMCQAYGYAKQENLIFQGYVNCCEGKLCNTDDYNIPTRNKLNNKKCPSCFKMDNLEECVSEEVMPCTGDQTMCFDYRGTVKTPDNIVQNYSTKGCANPTACLCNFNVAIGTEELYRETLKCTKATPVTLQ